VLQASAFAFMNRFADGLRLPSEDDKEVYGTEWKKPEKAGNRRCFSEQETESEDFCRN